MQTPDSGHVSTRRAIFVSFLVDFSDVILNVIVAILTGSAVMLAEAMQGTADLTAVSLLMIGHKRAERGSNKRYPFGYGKELYFWTLISAFIIFSITATLSFWFGLQSFRNPEPIEKVGLAVTVLIFAISSNGYAFYLSASRLRGNQRRRSLWRAFFESYDVAPKTTYIMDLMGTVSAAFGLLAIGIYWISGNQRFDGIGAMAIGVMLAVLALILLISLKDLITGRSAPPSIERAIRKAALSHPAVEEILDLRTMILGSEKFLVNIEVHLRAGLTTNAIEEDIDEIKAAIRAKVPSAHYIQVELETPDDELPTGKQTPEP